MMPVITGIIWVARFWNIKWVQYQLRFSIIIHLLLGIEVIFYIIPIRSDDTWFGWQSFSNKVEEHSEQYPNTFIFSSDDYKTSAILNFFLDEEVYAKNIVGEKALQFDFVGIDLHKLNGRDAIFIDSNPRFKNLETKTMNFKLLQFLFRSDNST